MRNFNSSLTIWIGIIFVSQVSYICRAYPNGRDYRNTDHLIKTRDVSSINAEKDGATIEFPLLFHNPRMEKSMERTWNPTKRNINENTFKSKRQSSHSIQPRGATFTKSSISQIIEQFIPKTATQSQQDEMCKCIDNATTELQNLLNQFKTTCINIRDGFSVGPPSKYSTSTYCNSSFIENAPAFIQNLIENPDQISQIPELLHSSVPSSQISHSIEKLKDLLQKIFELIQIINSKSEVVNYQSEENRENHLVNKKKTLETINKHIKYWKSKKSCKNENCNDQSCDKCSLNQNTIMLKIPSTVSMSVPSLASSLNPGLIQSSTSNLSSELAISLSSVRPSILKESSHPISTLPLKLSSTSDVYQNFNLSSTTLLPSILTVPLVPASDISSAEKSFSSLPIPFIPPLTVAIPSSSTLPPDFSIAPNLNPLLTYNLSQTIISESTLPTIIIPPSGSNQASALTSSSSKSAGLTLPSITTANCINHQDSTITPVDNKNSISVISSTTIPTQVKILRNSGSSIAKNKSAQLNNNYLNYLGNSNFSNNFAHLSKNYPTYYGNLDLLKNTPPSSDNYPNYFINIDTAGDSNYTALNYIDNLSFTDNTNYSHYPNYFKISNITGTRPVPSEMNIRALSTASIPSIPSFTFLPSTMPCTLLPINISLFLPTISPSPITLNPSLSIDKLQSTQLKSGYSKSKSSDTIVNNTKYEVLPIITGKTSDSKYNALKTKVLRLLSLVDSKLHLVQRQPKSQTVAQNCSKPVILSTTSPTNIETTQEQDISLPSEPCISSTSTQCVPVMPESNILVNPDACISSPKLYSSTIPELYNLPELKPNYTSISKVRILPLIESCVPSILESQKIEVFPSILKVSYSDASVDESKKSKESGSTKKNSKFNRFLYPRHIIQRSPGSKYISCQDSRSRHCNYEQNKARIHVLQINVPSRLQECQTKSIIPNQSIVSRIPTDLIGQVNSIILPSIKSAVNDYPKSTLGQLYSTDTTKTINSDFSDITKIQQNYNPNDSNQYQAYKARSCYTNNSPTSLQNEYSNKASQNIYFNIPLQIRDSNSSWQNKYLNALWPNNNSNRPSPNKYYDINLPQNINTNSKLLSKDIIPMPEVEDSDIPRYNEKPNVSFKMYPNTYLQGLRFNWKPDNNKIFSQSGYDQISSQNDYSTIPIQSETDTLHLSQKHSNFPLSGDLNINLQHNNSGFSSKIINQNVINSNIQSKSGFNIYSFSQSSNTPRYNEKFNTVLENETLNIVPQNKNLNINFQEDTNIPWKIRNSNNSLRNINLRQSTSINNHTLNRAPSTLWQVVNDENVSQNGISRKPFQNEYVHTDLQEESTDVPWFNKNYEPLSQGEYFNNSSPNVHSWKPGETNISLEQYSKPKEVADSMNPSQLVYVNNSSENETSTIPRPYKNSKKSKESVQNERLSASLSNGHPNPYSQFEITNNSFKNIYFNYPTENENENNLTYNMTNIRWQNDNSKSIINDGYSNSSTYSKNFNIILENENPNISLQNEQEISQVWNNFLQNKYLNNNLASDYLKNKHKNFNTYSENEYPTVNLTDSNRNSQFHNENTNIPLHVKDFDISRQSEQTTPSLQIINPNISSHIESSINSPQIAYQNSNLNSINSIKLGLNVKTDTSLNENNSLLLRGFINDSSKNSFLKDPLQNKYTTSSQNFSANNSSHDKLPYISSETVFRNTLTKYIDHENPLQSANIMPQNINSNIFLPVENLDNSSQNKTMNLSYKSRYLNAPVQDETSILNSQNRYINIPFQSVYPYIPLNNENLNITMQNMNSILRSQNINSDVLVQTKDLNASAEDENINSFLEDKRQNHMSESSYSSVYLQDMYSNISKMNTSINAFSQKGYYNKSLQNNNINSNIQGSNIDDILLKNYDLSQHESLENKNSGISLQDIRPSSLYNNGYLLNSSRNELSITPSTNTNSQTSSENENPNIFIQDRYPILTSLNNNSILSNRFPIADSQIANPDKFLDNKSFDMQNSNPSSNIVVQLNKLENQSAISSLNIVGTLNNKSALDSFESTASTVTDIITETPSIIIHNSKKHGFPLKTFRVTTSVVSDNVNDNSSLFTPKTLNNELPLKHIENTANGIINAISNASSLVTPQTSQITVHKEKLNSLDVINRTIPILNNSELTDLIKSYPQKNQFYLENKQFKNLDATNSSQAEYSDTPKQVISEESLIIPASLAKIEDNTNLLSKSKVAAPESVASTIANSVASVANSAAIVASSLSTAITQLTSSNVQRADLIHIPSSSQFTTYVTPPQTDIQTAEIIPSSAPQNIFLYRPKSQIGIKEDAQISLLLPREKISAAVTGGIILPGDMITIVLNNQTILVGKVVDSESPILFHLMKRNNHQSFPLQGIHNWKIISNECKDKEFQNILQQVSTNIIVS